MIAVAGGCATAAAAATLGAPSLLRIRGWSTRSPAIALWAWLGVFGMAIALGAGSLLLVVGACVSGHLSPGMVGTATFVGAWVALALVGALTALVVTRSDTMTLQTARGAVAAGVLCSRYGRPFVDARGITVTVIPADRPHALSVTSSRGHQIVLTNGLVESLTAREVSAVVEHERAHLTGRHQWLIRLGSLNRSCFPRLPSARGLDTSIRLLTELVADDVAARTCGHADVARALHRMARLTGDDSLTARAIRITGAAARTGVEPEFYNL